MTTMTADTPVSDVDMYSPEAIRDMHACDAQLREQAPVVYLSKYNIWATGRHEHVREVMRDYETYSSKSRPFHDPATVRPVILVDDDPPRHTKLRELFQRVLAPPILQRMKEVFELEAERLVDRLLARGEVDGHQDVAVGYVLKVFPDVMGCPDEDRENVLLFGELAFNTLGPPNDILRVSFERGAASLPWIDEKCKRNAIRPGVFGAEFFAAVDAGELSEEEAELLTKTFYAAGTDTTICAIENLLHAFAENPAEWQLVRQEPGLVRSAFDEILRYDAPARVGGRITTRETTIGGVRIPAGARISTLLLAAGRDPRAWTEAERFQVRRRSNGHVGLGVGIHACVGQMLARMEGEAIFSAFARKVERIEPAGNPVRSPNMIAHGWSRLPLRLVEAH
jgi:cytochrome P450